ncbi:MAG: ATP-grasp domain-containing protein, partial [Candidatus Marinimicrobia bacterium]|nr:ATP-grasp domain-containing protein [Candidatus Neomarinimicrobiota bacterium]
GALLDRLKIARPDYGIAHNVEEATLVAEEVGYPVLVRPSYVLGGRAMEIVYSRADLETYLRKHTGRGWDHPILIDVFLEDAYEFDVDALCDGREVFIAGIMQHIEEAGIHSGDSACVLPPYHLNDSEAAVIEKVTIQIALELGVKGLLNVQFAVKDDTVYVIEANPRASRTVPFVSKARNIPLAKWAAQIAAGKSLADVVGSTLSGSEAMARLEVVAVKKPVFPFSRFPADGVYLSPEMKSTGEVMGIDPGLGGAYAKAEMGAGTVPPASGTVFLSVNDRDKSQVVDIARDLHELGFSIIATEGTRAQLQQSGIEAQLIYKVGEGRPDAADAIRNREVQLIINTPLGAQSRHDEYAIGTSALQHGVPFVTTLSGARAMVRAIRRVQTGQFQVRSLQNLFSQSGG